MGARHIQGGPRPCRRDLGLLEKDSTGSSGGSRAIHRRAALLPGKIISRASTGLLADLTGAEPRRSVGKAMLQFRGGCRRRRRLAWESYWEALAPPRPRSISTRAKSLPGNFCMRRASRGGVNGGNYVPR